MKNAAMDVGKAETSTGVAVGETLVVEAPQAPNRGMQVMNADGVLEDFEVEGVVGPLGRSAANAATRHPDREPIVVVKSAELDTTGRTD